MQCHFSNMTRRLYNNSLLRPFTLLLFLVIFLTLLAPAGCLLEQPDGITQQEPDAPESFLLSWQRDPTSTMTIDWYPAPGSHPEMEYRRLSELDRTEADGDTVPGTHAVLEYRRLGEEDWTETAGEFVLVPGTDFGFRRTELTGLLPDQRYEFRFNMQPPVYHFRTMPEQLTRPIRFVAGGDLMHHAQWMAITAASVMRTEGADELDFAVIGGDLAYADAEVRKVGRWYDYFLVWSEEMITSDNRVIPHIAAIGNHEVRQGYIYNYTPDEYQQPDFVRREAPYFSTFIPFPGPDAFGVLDFGDYLSLFLLDTGHATFIDGEQTDWLRRELYQRSRVRHLIPVYHVPAWPSVRDFDGFLVSKVRNNWVPLFEEYGVRLAFENHDHTYKRTHPIRNGRIDETGIHYIGDGAWGVRTRQIRTFEDGSRPWYLAEGDSLRHFIMTEIDGDQIHLRMYEEHGSLIDQLTFTGGFSTARP